MGKNQKVACRCNESADSLHQQRKIGKKCRVARNATHLAILGKPKTTSGKGRRYAYR